MLLDVRGFVRGRVPWQGRTLEGSGATGARFGMSAVLRGKVVGGAKPWQGRALEGSGASGACFGRPRICVEGSSLLASRGAKPWQGLTLEGSGATGARFGMSAVLRGRVVTFGLGGRETVAGACSRGLWR